METLTSYEFTIFLSTIGLMLILARVISNLSGGFNVPTLVAELLAGILLGPTVLGLFIPALHGVLFPQEGGLPGAYDNLFRISVLMLLFLGGLELDFSLLKKERFAITIISLFTLILPLGICVFCGWKFFDFFHGTQYSASPFVFPMVFGVICSMSALVIIIRILLGQKLLNTRLGIIIVGSALVTDVAGWFGFSALLTYINPAQNNVEIIYTAIYLVLFFVVAFVVSSNTKLMKKLLSTSDSGIGKPSYDIALLLGICLLSAAFTNFIHVHATLGAFIAGIICKRIIGDDNQLIENLSTFILNFFSPIFFISIGLRINFADNFNFYMVFGLFFLTCGTKIIAALIGSLLSGFNVRSSLMIGMGLNARGSMEIIMGIIALKVGLIYSQLFVAFVLSAIVSSLMAEPLIAWLSKGLPRESTDP